MGITVNAAAKFKAKASIADMSSLKPLTSCTMAIKIDKAYILATDVDVQMPARVNRSKAKVEPLTTTKDIATDSLMQRLSELSLCAKLDPEALVISTSPTFRFITYDWHRFRIPLTLNDVIGMVTNHGGDRNPIHVFTPKLVMSATNELRFFA